MTALRPDLAAIAAAVPHGARVLDVGCGDGALLAALRAEKGVDGRGIELSGANVAAAVARGLSVVQGDADTDLGDYPTAAFDVAILSDTLQAMRAPDVVLTELVRIARTAVVAFPNFGHWSVRFSMLFSGQAPRTKLFPYEWYESPNIHYLTVHDFETLVTRQGFKIERRYFLAGSRRVTLFPNLMAEVAVFLVGK